MNPFQYVSRGLLYAAILISLASCSHPLNVPDQPIEHVPTRQTKQAPATRPNEVLLRHKYFEVRYDRKLRLARYVKYTLTKEHLEARLAKRKDHFIADPLLSAQE